ncbi:hypothetical protein K439DRAFT_916836 [Ramaria rubella]|nr:hypothetical protein K439DRAFT_916836 [Ramaria rubella]
MVVRAYLPPELVYECYYLMFPPSFFEPGSFVEKPAWKDIEGLTLVSKDVREITLKFWFHVLKISDLEDWKTIVRSWNRLYKWTRVIHYSSIVYKTPRYLLEPFKRLNSLRMDLPTTHVTWEGDFDFAAPEIAQILHEGIPGNIIQHLVIVGITWLDPFVMRHLAEGLPNLQTLRLKQPLVWCGLCNTIGAPSFKTIPGKIVYEGGIGLPDGYARYLAPLRYLRSVELSVACGEGDVDYGALFSNSPPMMNRLPAPRPPTDNPAPVPPERKAAGWSGECEACMTTLLEDDAFRRSWLARKEISQNSTINGSSAYPDRPPSLRRVEWNLLELSAAHWPGLLPFAGGTQLQNTMYWI